MFCTKCGSKIIEGTRFCTTCGTPLVTENVGLNEDHIINDSASQKENQHEMNMQAGFNQTYAENNQFVNSAEKAIGSVVDKTGLSRNAVIGIVVGSVVFIVLAIVLIIVLLANRYTKVNLNDVFTYEITGADGYGSVDSDLSYGALEEAILEAIDKKNADKNDMTELRIDLLIKGVDSRPINYSWDKSSGLSNGDEIHLTWDVNDEVLKEEYGIVLVHDDITAVVEGLDPVEMIDAFDGVYVYFDGFNGSGTAELDSSASPFSELELDYELDYNEGLSNGDVVTVTIESPYGDGSLEDYCASYGKMPSETSKQFIVEGLSEYLESADQITDDALEQIKTESESVLRAQQAEEMGAGEELVGLKYLKTYVLSAKPGVSDPNNMIMVVYELKAKNPEGESNLIQYCIYKDVVLFPSGELSIDFNNVINPKSGGWFGNNEGNDVYTKEGGTFFYHGYANLGEFIQYKITANEDQYVVTSK